MVLPETRDDDQQSKRKTVTPFPTSLHANEAAPCIEGYAVDESRGEEGNQEVERGMGSSNLFVEVLHEP